MELASLRGAVLEMGARLIGLGQVHLRQGEEPAFLLGKLRLGALEQRLGASQIALHVMGPGFHLHQTKLFYHHY